MPFETKPESKREHLKIPSSIPIIKVYNGNIQAIWHIQPFGFDITYGRVYGYWIFQNGGQSLKSIPEKSNSE